MRILITGANGMLGTELAGALAGGHEVTAAARGLLDITDPKAARAIISDISPEIVINCAALTRVDDCERQSALAYAVNAHGAGNIAEACDEAGAILYHISTDYIFDGASNTPYPEDAAPNPLNIYGKTKLEGERRVRAACERHYIIRTQWLYGGSGVNFVKTMLRLADSGAPLNVVDDQFGSPTCTSDLSEAIAGLIAAPSPKFGTYHITNSGICSRHGFASEIMRLSGRSTPVNPIKSDETRRPALRPPYSPLENRRWLSEGRKQPRSWRIALECYLDEVEKEGI